MPPSPTFSCPRLTQEELDAVSISWHDIKGADDLHDILDQHGYCVVTHVLSPDEIQTMEQQLTTEMNSLIDMDEVQSMSERAQKVYQQLQTTDGLKAWPAETLSECYAGKHGFLCQRGLAHSQAAWQCRLRCKRIYEMLHGTTDLVSSFDALFLTTASKANEPTTNNRAWPHVDLSKDDPAIPDFKTWQVYQSILYLWSSEANDASTTVVWPGSQKPEIYHRAYNSQHHPHVASSQQYCALLDITHADIRRDLFDNGWCRHARRVPVPAGGLVIWASQTTHQGWQSRGARLAVPVCWEPTVRRTEEARRRKMLLAALGLPSTHWASLGRTHAHKAAPQAVAALDIQNDVDSDDKIGFPLRGSIDCWSLDDDVDPISVWYMLRVPDMYRNNDDKILPHPEDMADLESMLRPEILQVL